MNQPLSPERLAKEFKFDPGPTEAPDRTEQVVGDVKARAEQLAGKQK